MEQASKPQSVRAASLQRTQWPSLRRRSTWRSPAGSARCRFALGRPLTAAVSAAVGATAEEPDVAAAAAAAAAAAGVADSDAAVGGGACAVPWASFDSPGGSATAAAHPPWSRSCSRSRSESAPEGVPGPSLR